MAGLRVEDHNRLLCVIADCSWCGAKRGEVCRHPVTKRVYSVTGNCCMHVSRKLAAKMWRESHPEKYKRLRDQLVARYTV